MHSSFNIVIFGEAGVGKRSVINLIAGRKVAETTPTSWECTLKSTQYTFQVSRRTYNIWCTTSLREPIFSAKDYFGAIKEAFLLIQQITAEGGLDLLLFCIPGSSSHISRTMLSNYWLFSKVLCDGRIPIALVVTHLETEAKMDDWWVRNVDNLSRCGLMFSGRACVTGLPEHEMASESRGALEHLLLDYDHEGRYIIPSPSDWNLGFLSRLASGPIPRQKGVKDERKQLERILRDCCMMPTAVARRLADTLVNHEGRNTMPPASSSAGQGFWKRLVITLQPKAEQSRLERDSGVLPLARAPGAIQASTRPLHTKDHTGIPSSFNIVLFGEAGVGKSSVVNLIAGRKVAETSGDSWGCTLESKQYTFEVANRTFNIWDTIGLGEPIFSVSNCLGAIEKTYALIRQIKAQGGLDLLLFCIPGSGSRISQTMLCNYRLFFEVFCEKRIPISVVVTRLEGEAKMEEWWNRNEKHISQSGLQFGGHACITGQREHPNAAEGRAALELLLLGYDHKGRYPMPPAPDWFAGFLRRLPMIPRSKEFKDKQKEVEKLLRDRCMMGGDDAQKLAEALTRSEQA